MATRMQQRRDTAANWTSSNPTLLAGEIGFETDTGQFKIGDGSTVWTSLSYAGGGADDTAYNATSWNTNTDAATKNAIRDKIETMDTAIGLNTAKDTNATHSSEVTGSGALTIADNVVDEANLKLDEGATNDYVLTADSAKSGGMKWAASSGGMSDLVDDTTPQLGGDLDLNQKGVSLNPAPTADVTGNGIIATMTVDANTVGVGSALHLDTDGNWIEADADTVATMPCAALALETGTGSKKVLFHGIIRNDAWAWTVGGLLYVSDTVGTLTHTAPTGSGDQVQVVGIATHADRIYFNPSLVLVEVA